MFRNTLNRKRDKDRQIYIKCNKTASVVLKFNIITLQNWITYDIYDWVLKFHISNKSNNQAMLGITSRSQLL